MSLNNKQIREIEAYYNDGWEPQEIAELFRLDLEEVNEVIGDQEQDSLEESIAIPLGNDRYALISKEDEDLARLNWYAHEGGKGDVKYHYAARRFHVGGGAREREWLHTVVMERILERALESSELADHINGDKLDNRRDNLRVASRTQNEANKKKRVWTKTPTSSQYKGVTFMKDRNRWRASIQKDGKQLFLGTFKDEIEAAKAYNKAAVEVYGEFAYLNEV